MKEITKEEFFKEYMSSDTRNNPNICYKWDFKKFKILCSKCGSDNVETDGFAESEGGYYGDHHLNFRVYCKCHNCGNFMGLVDDVGEPTFIDSNENKELK